MIGRVTVTAVEGGLPFRQLTSNCQQFSKVALRSEGLISTLLRRKWMLHAPDAKINQILLSPIQGRQRNGMCNNFSFLNNTDPYLGYGVTEKDSQEPSFYVVRDDLVHPLVNGNKARKLDGLLPLLVDQSVTDVVTCGGCQSAHAAAIERGLRSHLLLRGEQPEILTGYNLISTIHGHVTYVPRSVYAHRELMLKKHANLVAGLNGHVVSCNDVLEASFSNQSPIPSNFGQMGPHDNDDNCPRKVAIVNEGAGDAVALLGCIRLVEYLSQDHILGKERYIKLVVDAGTGTTAIGLGLGVHCLGLPWEVTAVVLADTIKAYMQQEKYLISDFRKWLGFHLIDHTLHEVEGGIVNWVERNHKRKFGNVLEGEIEACQKIAQQTGILVDPMYTLAAWEMATQLCKEERVKGGQVVMLHTGGTLGMFGLAQSYVLGDPTTKPKGYDPMSEAVLLWERDKSGTKTRYNLTPFAISLNELTSGLLEKLPPTDSRLSPDQRHLENGEYELANAEKLRLEQLQRQARRLQERGWQPRWFQRDEDGCYRYWEARERNNWDEITDIFGQNNSEASGTCLLEE